MGSIQRTECREGVRGKLGAASGIYSPTADFLPPVPGRWSSVRSVR
jgi:hypothetical protein